MRRIFFGHPLGRLGDEAPALLFHLLAELLQPDGVHADEASGALGSKVSNLVHGALALVVELLGVGPAANDAEHALVGAAADGAVDGLLGGGDAVLEELTLGREVETVVEDLGVVEGGELVTESADFTVENETLDVDVSGAEHGKTGGLVAATGLEADETVLDNVDTADTVPAGNGVGSEEELDGLGDALAVLVLELDRETLLEVDSEVLRGVGCLGGVDGQLPHVLGRSDVGVLEDAGLVAAVCHVLVHAPWLALGAGDGDALLGGVVEEVVAALEAVVEDGVPPGCDDLDAGLESVEGQLEADLVVTLTSAAVGDGEAALLLGDGDLGTGDDGAGKGGTEEVCVLRGMSALVVDGLLLNECDQPRR